MLDNHAANALVKLIKRKRATEKTLESCGMKPDRSIEELCRS
jgi:hypothetical protein